MGLYYEGIPLVELSKAAPGLRRLVPLTRKQKKALADAQFFAGRGNAVRAETQRTVAGVTGRGPMGPGGVREQLARQRFQAQRASGWGPRGPRG